MERLGVKKTPVTNTGEDNVKVTGDNDEEAPATTNTNVDTDTRFVLPYDDAIDKLAEVRLTPHKILILECLITHRKFTLIKLGRVIVK